MTIESALTFHRLARRIQQLNKFVGPDIDSGLTPLESHVLIELHAHTGCSTKELSDLLMVEPSICTRVVQKFIKKGWAFFKAHANNSKAKGVCLSKNGVAFCKSIDKPADAIVEQLAASISTSDFNLLVEFLETLADTEGIPRSNQPPGEHKYRVQQRRVTRLFGLLGNKAWNTEFSSSEYQILAVCSFAEYGPRISELAELLSLKSNTVAETVSKLSVERLVERHADPVDSRASVVVSTKLGKTRFFAAERLAAECFIATLSQYSDPEVSRILSILRTFAGTSDPMLPFLLPSLSIREVKAVDEIARCRGFIARTFVNNDEELLIPAELLTNDFRVFEFLRDGETVSVLGYPIKDNQEICGVFAASSSLPGWSCMAIMCHLRDRFHLQSLYLPLLGKHQNVVTSPSLLGGRE